MLRGVSHAEFIKGAEDGRFYFLETAARVGGANIAEMVHVATGINLWQEWARIELSNLRGEPYRLPDRREDFGAVMVCLAQQERPDLSSFDAPEIVWRLQKKHHAGLVLASADQQRIEELLDDYGMRMTQEFLAYAPPLEEAE
jgi:biotin carboxylase